MRLADHIRHHAASLVETWAALAPDQLPDLRRLDRARLLDALPQTLGELAGWIDGAVAAEEACGRLAAAHADGRVAAGVSLATLVREYQLLRDVVLASLAAPRGDAGDEDEVALRRLHEAVDSTLAMTVARYAERRERLRDRFLAILGHDLRGPLHVVHLALHQLGAPDEDERAQVVERGLRAAARMERLVRDLLDFARTALGAGLPLRRAATDLGAVGRAVVDEAAAAFPGRAPRLETDGALDGSWDPERVAQALANLVGNALRHGGEPVVLRLCGESQAVISEVSDAATRALSSADDGLFDPFRGGGDGPGLGLYIVQEIAHAHGTACEVEQRDGRTVFRIRWPRRPPGEAATG